MVRIGTINTLPLVARWDTSTRGSSRRDRVRGFRTTVLDRWTPVPYLGFIPVPDDSALARYIDWLTPRLNRVYRLARGAEIEMQPAAARVARVFPSLADTVRLAIIALSLGTTNGTVRVLERKPMLILGADVQTVLPDSDSYLRATLEHELVHVAHAAVNVSVYSIVEAAVRGERTPLYVSLFSEGLATWGSARADPTLQPAHYYMTAGLPGVPRATCERLAPLLRSELESADPQRYADWFFLSGKDANIPRRYAYVLGERIVRRLAEKYSPTQLLRLDAPTILREVRSVLARPAALCS